MYFSHGQVKKNLPFGCDNSSCFHCSFICQRLLESSSSASKQGSEKHQEFWENDLTILVDWQVFATFIFRPHKELVGE